MATGREPARSGGRAGRREDVSGGAESQSERERRRGAGTDWREGGGGMAGMDGATGQSRGPAGRYWPRKRMARGGDSVD